MSQLTARQISSRGKRCFQSWLKLLPHWIVRDQEDQDDIGIDGEMEVLDKSDVSTGVIFKYQLKCHGSLRIRDDTAICRELPVVRMQYYLHKVRLPVVLFAVDVSSERIFWQVLHGSSSVEQAVASAAASNRRVMSLLIPCVQSVDAVESLLAQIAIANMSIAAAHPNIATFALARDRKALEAADPRFQVRVTADETKQVFHLRPITDVELTFSTSNDIAASAKLESMIHKGIATTFKSDELLIKGSPLFDIFKPKQLKLQIGKRLRAQAELVIVDGAGREINRFRGFEGIIEGGLTQSRITASSPHSLLTFESGWFRRDEGANVRRSITLHYHFGQWRGRHLLSLPFFNQIFQYLRDPNVKTVQMEFWKRGALLFTLNMERLLEKDAGIFRYIDAVAVARQLAPAFGINPLMPEIVNISHLDELEYLHWLYSADTPSHKMIGWCVNAAVPRQMLSSLIAVVENGNPTFMLEDVDARPFSIFGHPIEVGHIRRKMTDLVLGTPVDTLRAHLQQNEHEDVPVVWNTTAESMLTAEKLDLVKPMLVNFNDGILMALTASGALKPVDEALQRTWQQFRRR